MEVNITLTLKKIHCILCVLCVAVIIAASVIHSVIFNVHLSPYYVQHRARLFPASFNISHQCSWNKKPHNFSDYKPRPLVLIAHALSDIYVKLGIKSVLRDGSLLHVYRHVKADDDMDIWMIIPKNMTLSNGYDKVKHVMRSNSSYTDLLFEHQNMVLMSLFYQYSDAVRISYKGLKIVDINVLHETFINDPSVQTPCLKQMECGLRDDDAQFLRQFHIIRTKNLFENLCKCQFMDAELFCVSAAGEYLELRYGKNFTKPIAKEDFVRPRQMIYERPFKTWRNVIYNVPVIAQLKPYFEGHQNENANLTTLRK